MRNFIFILLLTFISFHLKCQDLPNQIEKEYYDELYEYVKKPLVDRVDFAKVNFNHHNVFNSFIFINDLEALSNVRLDDKCYDITGEKTIIRNKHKFNKSFRHIKRIISNKELNSNGNYVEYSPENMKYPETYLYIFFYMKNSKKGREIYYNNYKDIMPIKTKEIIEIDLKTLAPYR
jgi:hypothetical protein